MTRFQQICFSLYIISLNQDPNFKQIEYKNF